MHVKKGDLVQVMSGNQKGTRGLVLGVDLKNNRVKVEGVRVVKKHVKPAGGQPGRVEEKPAFIPASKVMLIDPKTDTATRIRYQVVDGRKVRVSQKSGTVIDKPFVRAESK